VKLSKDLLRIDSEDISLKIVSFIKHRVGVAGAEGVVIGTSGGLDSSTVAILCAEALGPEKTLCLILPEQSSPTSSNVEDALSLCEKFNLQYEIIEISPILASFKKACSGLNLENEKIVFGNIKARTRMMILYAYANTLSRLVVGTGNKSEIATGYFTKYGDGGVDILPIGDLYKTQVRQLAKALGVPEKIMAKSPSAGLWPGQTDEEELGISYDQLDLILYGLEFWMLLEEIAEQLKISLEKVKNIEKKIHITEHKRRGSIILKLGYRTFGLDWRVPLDQPINIRKNGGAYFG